MSARRFDVHTLAVILPFIILVTLGLTVSLVSLTYNSHHEEKGGFEVNAWWDGDHADISVKPLRKTVLPASIAIVSLKEEEVHMFNKTVISADAVNRGILLNGVTTSKNFLVIIATPDETIKLNINLR